MWRNDNTDIDIGGEYELNDFDKETTENGCTVTLNFDLKSKKKNKSASETTKKKMILCKNPIHNSNWMLSQSYSYQNFLQVAKLLHLRLYSITMDMISVKLS